MVVSLQRRWVSVAPACTLAHGASLTTVQASGCAESCVSDRSLAQVVAALGCCTFSLSPSRPLDDLKPQEVPTRTGVGTAGLAVQRHVVTVCLG